MIALPNDTAGQLYEIPTNKIDHIIYHEDLIIRRAGLLADQNKFRDRARAPLPARAERAGLEGTQGRVASHAVAGGPLVDPER